MKGDLPTVWILPSTCPGGIRAVFQDLRVHLNLTIAGCVINATELDRQHGRVLPIPGGTDGLQPRLTSSICRAVPKLTPGSHTCLAVRSGNRRGALPVGSECRVPVHDQHRDVLLGAGIVRNGSDSRFRRMPGLNSDESIASRLGP